MVTREKDKTETNRLIKGVWFVDIIEGDRCLLALLSSSPVIGARRLLSLALKGKHGFSRL